MAARSPAPWKLYERGIITREDTGGLEIKFGNASILEKLVELTALRKGIGDKLAEGSRKLAEFFEHPEVAITVKGQELPAYDPRASLTQALGYMTSPTGACHLRGGFAASLAFFGGTKEIPRFSAQQAPVAIRNVQNLGIIQDSLGICRFTGFAISSDPWARMISGITGQDISTATLEKMANRVATLERIFNVKAGLKPDDDSLPARFAEMPITVGGGNGRSRGRSWKKCVRITTLSADWMRAESQARNCSKNLESGWEND